MQRAVYYFSGTGNSLFVVREAAARINGSLKPIARCKNEEYVVIDEEMVGIVFPTYLAQLYGVLEIVHQFIGKAKLTGAN